MTDRMDRTDPVIAAIKKLAPASLRVVLVDGTDRAVAMPKSGNRWSRLVQVLDSLQWERIEGLDKDGKLVGAPIERELEDNLEDFDDDVDDVGGIIRSVLRDAMRMNLEVMRTTMKETRQIFDAQTKSQSDIVHAMAESLRVVQESYTLAMKVQTANILQGAGADDNGEVMKMLQMAMMMQAKGIAPPPPPAPPPARKP